MKILLAIDGSAYTKRMLGYVAAHEELLGPTHEYTVLTVIPEIPAHARKYIDRATLESYYADEANEVLEPVLKFAAQNGWNIKSQQRIGNPGDLVAEAASAHDLVIMGSHGHSALVNTVLGSVTSRVLAQCKTPVLIVR